MYATLSDREGVSKSYIGLAKLLSGDSAGALTEFEQVPDEDFRLMLTSQALYDLGREDESAAAIQRLHEITEEFVETYDAEFDDGGRSDAEWLDGFARAYAWTDNSDEAFRYLRLLAGEGSDALGNLASDPLFVRLHDDPRWLPFLEEFGRSPEQLAKIAFTPRLPDEFRSGN
jgi:tetratricopeptide (TPR) repeat protein